jgi:hypothetical protein
VVVVESYSTFETSKQLTLRSVASTSFSNRWSPPPSAVRTYTPLSSRRMAATAAPTRTCTPAARSFFSKRVVESQPRSAGPWLGLGLGLTVTPH